MEEMHGKEKDVIDTVTTFMGDSDKLKIISALFGFSEEEKNTEYKENTESEYTKEDYISDLDFLMSMNDSCIIGIFNEYLDNGNKPIPAQYDGEGSFDGASDSKREMIYHAMGIKGLMEKEKDGYVLNEDLFNDLKLAKNS